jgi:hypothetical protein
MTSNIIEIKVKVVLLLKNPLNMYIFVLHYSDWFQSIACW